MSELPVYRVIACNTSADSENKIHDDKVAETYGFRGGLVPGVTVYGYMTVPVVQQFGAKWLERGSMEVRFHKPFYEGDQVMVRSEMDGTKLALRAEKEGGTLCATAVACVEMEPVVPLVKEYPTAELPEESARPVAESANLAVGTVLGTLTERFEAEETANTLLEKIDEKLPLYFGSAAVAHPALLLGMANRVFVRNYLLGPWIHSESRLQNFGVAENGDVVSIRGRIDDRFERKGHEFVVLDLLLIANGARPIQQVFHTAIYSPRRS